MWLCSNNAFISQPSPAFLCHQTDTCLVKAGVAKDFLPGKADKALLTGSSRGCALTNGSSTTGAAGEGGKDQPSPEKGGETWGSVWGRGGVWQLQGATPEPSTSAWLPEPALMAGEQQQKEKFKVSWETQINPFANPASASQTVWYFCPLEAWDHFLGRC